MTGSALFGAIVRCRRRSRARPRRRRRVVLGLLDVHVAAAEAVGDRRAEEVVVRLPDDQARRAASRRCSLAVNCVSTCQLSPSAGEVLADEVHRAERGRRGGRVELEVVRRHDELAGAVERRRERARGGRAAVAVVPQPARRAGPCPGRRTRPSGRRPGAGP